MSNLWILILKINYVIKYKILNLENAILCEKNAKQISLLLWKL